MEAMFLALSTARQLLAEFQPTVSLVLGDEVGLLLRCEFEGLWC